MKKNFKRVATLITVCFMSFGLMACDELTPEEDAFIKNTLAGCGVPEMLLDYVDITPDMLDQACDMFVGYAAEQGVEVDSEYLKSMDIDLTALEAYSVTPEALQEYLSNFQYDSDAVQQLLEIAGVEDPINDALSVVGLDDEQVLGIIDLVGETEFNPEEFNLDVEWEYNRETESIDFDYVLDVCGLDVNELIDIIPIDEYIADAIIEELQLGIDSEDLNLKSIDLSWVDLGNLDLSGIGLEGVDLSGIDINFVLDKIDATQRLKDAFAANGFDIDTFDWSKVDFSNVDLSSINLALVDLTGVDLSNIVLSELSNYGIDVSGVDLSAIDFVEIENNIIIQAAITAQQYADFADEQLKQIDMSQFNDYSLDDLALIGIDMAGLEAFTGFDFSSFGTFKDVASQMALYGIDVYNLSLEEFMNMDWSQFYFDPSIIDLSAIELDPAAYGIDLSSYTIESLLLDYVDLGAIGLTEEDIEFLGLGNTALSDFNYDAILTEGFTLESLGLGIDYKDYTLGDIQNLAKALGALGIEIPVLNDVDAVLNDLDVLGFDAKSIKYDDVAALAELSPEDFDFYAFLSDFTLDDLAGLSAFGFDATAVDLSALGLGTVDLTDDDLGKISLDRFGIDEIDLSQIGLGVVSLKDLGLTGEFDVLNADYSVIDPSAIDWENLDEDDFNEIISQFDDLFQLSNFFNEAAEYVGTAFYEAIPAEYLEIVNMVIELGALA